MHRLSLFQKHQGSPEKNTTEKKIPMDISCFLVVFPPSVVFVGVHFSKLPIFLLGGWKNAEVFWGDFWTKARPRALWKDATEKPIRSTEEEPWKKAARVGQSYIT